MSASAAHPLLAAALTEALQDALGRYLALAPNRAELLAHIAGRVIALELRPFGKVLYLCPADSDIQFLTEISGAPDVTVAGSPSAFVRLGLGSDAEKTLSAGEIDIMGDADTARRFQDLFRKLEIDWAHVFTHVTGSHRASSTLLSVLRASAGWARDTVDAFQTDLSEYLREEARLLPAPPETDAFTAEVDTLRASHDRLNARIARLQAALTTPHRHPPVQTS